MTADDIRPIVAVLGERIDHVRKAIHALDERLDATYKDSVERRRISHDRLAVVDGKLSSITHDLSTLSRLPEQLEHVREDLRKMENRLAALGRIESLDSRLLKVESLKERIVWMAAGVALVFSVAATFFWAALKYGLAVLKGMQ